MNNLKKIFSGVLAVAVTAGSLTAIPAVNADAAKVKVGKPVVKNVTVSPQEDAVGLTFNWKKIKKAKGYQYRYNLFYSDSSTVKDFSKKKTVKDAKVTVSFQDNSNIKFQVRAFKKVDGKKVFSKWASYELSEKQVEGLLADYQAEIENNQLFQKLTEHGMVLADKDSQNGISKDAIKYFVSDIDEDGSNDLVYERTKGNTVETEFYYYDEASDSVKAYTKDDKTITFTGVGEIKADDVLDLDTTQVCIRFPGGTGTGKYVLYKVSSKDKTFKAVDTYEYEYDANAKFVKATKNGAAITEADLDTFVKTYDSWTTVSDK
ncbi:MAG: hypothetical protein K6F00_11890 [Lachnospiraceae bacterium]|nr:hypothetical protein [Lachnospiraceae bacterium]